MSHMYDSVSLLSLLLIFSLFSTVRAQNAPRKETLEEAWAASSSVDRHLRSASKNTASAEQSLLAARAARLPSISTNNTYTILSNQLATALNLDGMPITIPVPSQIPFSEERFFATTTMVTLPLFTSGLVSHGIDAASAAAGAIRLDEKRTALDLKMRVAETYVAVLRAGHLVEVAESSIASLEAHATDARNLFEQGVAAKNDLLAAQVALAEAHQQSIKANNGLDLSRAAYNRLLGRQLTQPVELSEPAAIEVEGDLANLTARALKERPELQALAEQSRSLRHEAANERAATRPQVSVSGGYTFLQNRFLTHQGFWSATVGVKWNLFDGGVARRKAYALEQKADALLDLRADLETAIALQVRQAWLEVEETRRRIELTRETVEQAEENLKVAEDRYDAGVGAGAEVLVAEALRIRTITDYHNAIYDAVLTALRLRRAVGDL